MAQVDRSQGWLVMGMGSCYALGTFTDNFYKQCAVLLAASMGMTAMQSLATVLFSLPFILFSAWAGWTADRMVKKHIVVAAKITELLALVLGGYALVHGWWPGILITVFIMGLQATAFSPALNGSIPESFALHMVPRVNSYIKLGSTMAVLAGIAAAGFFLDMQAGPFFSGLVGDGGDGGDIFGRYASSVFILVIAFLGVLTAFTLKRTEPSATCEGARSFPWTGPRASVFHFLETRNDPQLFLILLAEGFFYGVAAIAVICVANISEELGYSKTMASLFSAAIMVGIAVGALIAGRYDAYSWRRLLVPSAVGMGGGLVLVACTPLFGPEPYWGGLTTQMAWFASTLFGTGICGGIYLIPIASFIQVRPADGAKGKILGVSNFFSFVAIAAFGIVFYPVSMLPAPWTFATFGLGTLGFALFYLHPAIRRHCFSNLAGSGAAFRGRWMRALLSLRYRIRLEGLDSLAPHTADGKTRPILFLPNHPALVDPAMVYAAIAGLKPHTLVDSRQVTGILKPLGRAFGVITIPDIKLDGRKSTEGVRQGLEAMAKVLRGKNGHGGCAILYPAGRIYRSEREVLGNNSGAMHLIDAVPDLRVVLVRTSGLWGSSFGYAQGRPPRLMQELLGNALALLVNGIFFMPRRGVTLTFHEPDDLPRTAGKRALNRYLEDFYNQTAGPSLHVPRFFWRL